MRNILRLVGLLTTLVLAACGGGGGSSDSGGGGGGGSVSVGTAEGQWFGTTGDGRFVNGVVLEDGTYWFMYSGVNAPAVYSGFIQGSSTSTNGNFTSSNTRNFNFALPAIEGGSISGNYVEKQMLDGSAPGNSGSVVFNLTYKNDYDQSIDNNSWISGTYSGPDYVTGEQVTVSINGAGSPGPVVVVTSVSESGCQSTGTVRPNSGGNVYDISLTFEGGTCSNGTDTVSGIVLLKGRYRGGTNLFGPCLGGCDLISAALNPARTNGFLFVGSGT